MPRFVIDLADSPQAWDELYRKIERWGEERSPSGGPNWEAQRAPGPEEMASFLSALWYTDVE